MRQIYYRMSFVINLHLLLISIRTFDMTELNFRLDHTWLTSPGFKKFLCL